jgi:sugar O-acyltransferase (sialic acid O-acetyltransferase NeuD family)
MNRLLIVGAGGFGREMFAAAREAVGYGTAFEIKGFLDAKPTALDGFAGYPPIVGSPDTYEPGKYDVFVTALGSVASRRRCAEALEARGAEFVSVVHRTATIGPNVVIGAGSFIAPHVSLTADVSVGRHVSVFHSSSIGHDSRLGDFSHVYAQCSIGGSVVLGEGAIVYPGSVVAPRRKVGAAAVVGAGSAVFVDVDPGVTVLGNPARPID